MLIRQLNYLVALAREGHFGRAAQACNVSQPALSAAVRNFEDELGIVVVRRGRRFEGFTSDGERVLAWAQRVLADCEGLRQEARQGPRGPAGTLRLGAIPTVLPIVPLLTDGCLRRHAHVKHEVYALSATEIQRRIANFELDAGLSYLEDERLREFKTVPLMRERYVLIARDATAFEGRTSMSWVEAARLPLCLLTCNMQCRRGIDAAFAAAGAKADPRVETDSLMTLYAHVRMTDLYSVVPHSVLCLQEMRDEIAAIPMAPQLQREIGLILLDREPGSPVLDAAVASFRAVDLQARVDAGLRALLRTER